MVELLQVKLLIGKNVKIAGLILASYCHNNLKDILEW